MLHLMLLLIMDVIEAGIIAPLVQLLQSAEFGIKAEAAWAISNATHVGTHKQIKFLVSQGCIKPLCDLLICPDPSVVTVCLEGLANILNTGEAEKSLGNTGDKNLYAQMIEDAEGLEKVESLQSHDNNDIYEKAGKILEAYWVDDKENELLLPGDISQAGLHFGGDKPPMPPGGFDFG
uniref:Importin subunit alpha n=1 Tax=Rhizophora mucronata TaxID=61149 RepID=A0A2P2LDW3_RHIMU